MIDLLKHYAYAKTKAGLSYYRDANTKEIGLFVEENNRIHPLEIKKSASPDRREVRKFGLLDKHSWSAAMAASCACAKRSFQSTR